MKFINEEETENKTGEGKEKKIKILWENYPVIRCVFILFKLVTDSEKLSRRVT